MNGVNGNGSVLTNAQVLDYESVIAGGGLDENEESMDGDRKGSIGEAGDDDQDMKSVWKEFSEGSQGAGGGGTSVSASSSLNDPSNFAKTAFSTSAPTPSGSKRDPFEGMSLAQIRSRANSLEAVDRDAARYESFGVGSGLEASDRAAFEVRDQVKKEKGKGKGKGKEKEKEPTKGKRKNSRGDGGAIGKKNKNLAPAPPNPHESVLASSPSTVESTSPTLTTASEDASPNFDQNGKAPAGSKKNRNPHATQLPGNGQRKTIKEEAGEGHSGPICSHCGSITTPLWRRGPDDELLCNA